MYKHSVFSIFLPLLGEVAHYAYASCAVTSTYTTLVKLELGANYAVAARSYTFPLHAHRTAVRTTLCPIYHLKTDTVTISFLSQYSLIITKVHCTFCV